MKKRQARILSTTDECSSLTEKSSYDLVHREEYFMSEVDRITVIHGITHGRIESVINVSYEISIKSKWITITRFDSSHGFLHRHRRISLHDQNTTVENFNIIKKGNPKTWLTWARRYMNKRFYEEKVGFCKRSKINILDLQ